jgi:glycine/D-amino acid oxidase-like deaminating enzyme
VRPEQHFLAMPKTRERSDAATLGAPDAEIDPRFAGRRDPAPAHPVLLDLELGFYTRCEPSRQRTRVGAMDYERDQELDDPDQLDERVGDEFRRWARAVLEQRLPGYRGERDLDSQAAWYTLTPDAQAVIGLVPGFENLYVASGFSGHGFKLAPSIGEGVAQLLRGEPVGAFDAAFFAPQRFTARASSAWGGRFGL